MAFDVCKMQFRTSQALCAIEGEQVRAAQLLLDPTKDERRDARMCRLCYYAPGMLASGEYACEVCEKPVRSSGRRRSVCEGCADEHSLCVVCGADRELRERRRK